MEDKQVCCQAGGHDHGQFLPMESVFASGFRSGFLSRASQPEWRQLTPSEEKHAIADMKTAWEEHCKQVRYRPDHDLEVWYPWDPMKQVPVCNQPSHPPQPCEYMWSHNERKPDAWHMFSCPQCHQVYGMPD